jgi:hypothetical protein
MLACGSFYLVGPGVGHRQCMVCFVVFCGHNLSGGVKARTISPLSKK